MDKHQAAVHFFEQLVSGSNDFVTSLIDAEMDPQLIELLNTFGAQLQRGDIEPDRFQASLLIIGYLLRAYETRAASTLQ